MSRPFAKRAIKVEGFYNQKIREALQELSEVFKNRNFNQRAQMEILTEIKIPLIRI